MGKLGYKISHAFKSKEAIRVEARMQFNQNKRSFTKYYQELDASIKAFSKMAQDSELSGNHENAVSCARFVVKLQKTQVKVQGLLQRFEMMYSMMSLTDVMTSFMKACANMGFNMDSSINLKQLWKNTAEMDKALNKLDAMSEQMDMVFDTIDAGMNDMEGVATTQSETDAEAEKILGQIMGRYNTVTTMPQTVAEHTPQAVSTPDQAQNSEMDDTDERLRRMMQELKS